MRGMMGTLRFGVCGLGERFPSATFKAKYLVIRAWGLRARGIGLKVHYRTCHC